MSPDNRDSPRRKLFGARGRGSAGQTTSVFYASDFHGSDQCWKKFLSAAKFYGTQVLIMGGDLAGKAMVPITAEGDKTYRATFMGELRTAKSDSELEELIQVIRYNGMYPWVAPPSEVDRFIHDDDARDELFNQVILDELRRWVSIADERFGDSGVPLYIIPGNDDPWECDQVLEEGKHVEACDDRIVKVGPHEMISCSYSNTTPWHSPRELDEDALYARLKLLADQLTNPSSAIFMVHVPPYDSGLDRAVEINPDLTPVRRGGQLVEGPVGSRAVRQIIEEFQPLLSLHGHIHESRGVVRIGRTVSVNAGSEYNSGRLHGIILSLSETEVLQSQLVVG